MNKVTSYYDLLGISPEADRETILAAIAELRKKDNHNSYASMLDNIELHLSDSHKRKAYNDFLESQQSTRQRTSPNTTGQPTSQRATSASQPNAKHRTNHKTGSKTRSNTGVKVGHNAGQTISASAQREIRHSHRDNKRQLPTKHQGTPQPHGRVNHSDYSDAKEGDIFTRNKRHFSNDKAAHGLKPVKMRSSYLDTNVFNTRLYGKLFSWLVLLALIAALAWLGNRAYVRWQVFEQSAQAADSLRLATTEVENYIRRNRYFPEQITNPTLTSPYYTIEIVDKDIVLTFSAQAADSLPNTQLKMLAREVPKIGLAWHCVPAAGFPMEYLPQKCY